MQDIKILDLILTNKCDLNCSFCGGESYMKEGGDAGTKALLNEVEVALEGNPELDEMIWKGGEPLLAISKVGGMFPLVKSLRPELRHDFMTNGLRLKVGHVELLSQFERVTVSIDGFNKSERPLRAFIDGGNCEALEAMSLLKNKRTWAVITRDQLNDPRWYEDILDLHNAIYHLGWSGMSLLFDNKMTKELTPDHILNFIWGFKRLRENICRLNELNNHETAVIVEKFFTHEQCVRCSQTLMLKANGDSEYFNDVDTGNGLVTGCNELANTIGHDAYRYLHKFLNAGS